MMARPIHLPLLGLLAVLLCWLSTSPVAAQETFHVTGYLVGASFFVNYTFDCVAIDENAFGGSFGSTYQYVVAAVSGTRT